MLFEEDWGVAQAGGRHWLRCALPRAVAKQARTSAEGARTSLPVDVARTVSSVLLEGSRRPPGRSRQRRKISRRGRRLGLRFGRRGGGGYSAVSPALLVPWPTPQPKPRRGLALLCSAGPRGATSYAGP